MTGDREILAERVRERIEQLGRNPRDVSMAAIGKPDLVRDIYRQKRMPTGPAMLDLARELETTTDWLLGQAATPAQPVSEVAVNDNRLPYRGPGREASLPLVGTGDCAELEVCDDSGKLVAIERSSFDPDYHVRMIVRPPALAGVKEAYAIEFRGDSMAPRYEAGDLGIVDPRRAYGAGDYIVVQLRDDHTNDVGSVIVKRLVRSTPRELLLEQFNPPMTFALPRERVLRIHRILRDVEYWS